MKKVVIIFGSPRKNSNTHILINEIRKGLAFSNVESKIFFLNDLNIKGCQACYYCKNNDTKICAVKDDMQQIYDAMENSDGLIVATPIYFADVTAQVKLWIDRLFCYYNLKLESKFPMNKKLGLLITQNQPNEKLFINGITTFKNMLSLLGYNITQLLHVCNLDKGNKPMVTQSNSILEKAYIFGRDFLC